MINCDAKLGPFAYPYACQGRIRKSCRSSPTRSVWFCGVLLQPGSMSCDNLQQPLWPLALYVSERIAPRGKTSAWRMVLRPKELFCRWSCQPPSQMLWGLYGCTATNMCTTTARTRRHNLAFSLRLSLYSVGFFKASALFSRRTKMASELLGPVDRAAISYRSHHRAREDTSPPRHCAHSLPHEPSHILADWLLAVDIPGSVEIHSLYIAKEGTKADRQKSYRKPREGNDRQIKHIAKQRQDATIPVARVTRNHSPVQIIVPRQCA